jgi:hypothetical protein
MPQREDGEDNTKIYLTEIRSERADLIALAQNKDQWHEGCCEDANEL